MRHFWKIAGGLLVAAAIGIVVMACEEVLDPKPTGSIDPKPGAPLGELATLPVFDINNLPSVEWWNSQGHFHSLPDLFQFADGSRVQNASDWERRREEIKKILQYYEYGDVPAWPDEITWTDTVTATSITTVIHITVGSNHEDLTVVAALPASPQLHNGKIPILFESTASNSSNQSALLSAGYATAGINYTAIEGEGNYMSWNPSDGIVGRLFGWPSDQNANDNIGCLTAQAWGMSVIIWVMEAGGFDGKIDPTGVMVTGMSRWGKSACVIGAFADTKPGVAKHTPAVQALYPNGNRVALTISGSAGSGGPAIERFMSPMGYNYGIGDVDYINPEGAFETTVGKTVYLNPFSDTTNASGSNAVIGVLEENWVGTAGGGSSWNEREVVGWGFIQKIAEARHETGFWFNNRIRQFTDLHLGLDTDHDLSASPDLGRTKDGFLCTTPFDQHFLLALCAPNGVIIHDGYQTGRNDPESQYLNYLATKEVYALLGKENNIGIRLYNIPHSQPNYEFEDMAHFAAALFDATPDIQDGELPNFRIAAYPIDDPRSKYDYYRLNWAAPGRTSIADQVKAALGE
jgi:hypothetical protein